MVDAGVQAEIKVLLNDLTGDVADGLESGSAVVRALRGGITFGGETERTSVLIEEVFLFESEPCAGIVKDGGAAIGRMRGDTVGHHDFAHHKCAIAAGAVREDGYGFEHTIRAAAFGLLGRATVESPHRKLVESREAVEILDQGFATEVRNGGVAVEPDVFQFVFGHSVGRVCWLMVG